MKIIKTGGWRFNTSLETEYFEFVEEGKEILKKWERIFPKEKTWVQKNFGVPSLIVRMDCTVYDGKLGIYEIEERPSQVGIARVINRQFAEILKKLMAEWPEFVAVISPRRGQKIGDDGLWIQTIQYFPEELPKNINKVIVRAEPTEVEFHCLQPKSVSTVTAKGNKSYGEKLGWWKKIRSGSCLPWEEGFVLKPLQGSKMQNVEIWDPEQRPRSSTRDQVLATLEKNVMYCQPFLPPIKKGGDWCMYRPFYGYSPKEKDWVPMGGIWVARSNLRVHGTRDAVFGPLLL